MVDRRLVSLHESAHVVAGALLGFRPVHATVIPNDAREGGATIEPHPTGRTPEGLAVIVAGDVAVEFALAGSRLPTAGLGAWSIRSNPYRPMHTVPSRPAGAAGDAAVVQSARPSAAMLAKARRDAGLICVHRWPAIVAIADELLAHGELGERQLEQLLETHGVKPGARNSVRNIKPASQKRTALATKAKRPTSIRVRLEARRPTWRVGHVMY